MLHLITTAAWSLVAAACAARMSFQALHILLLAIAFSRLMRRVLDWEAGSFSAVTLVSLLPCLIALTMAPPVAQRFHRLPSNTRKAAMMFVLALAYATALGISNGLGAAYEAVQYGALLIVFLFAMLLAPSPKAADRWIQMLVWSGVAVALYGWFQLLFLPPWDAAWMRWSEMGSIGAPEPMRVRVFSTLAAPGPAATYLNLALMPALMQKRWRAGLGWLAPVLILSGLLLTMVRSQWLALAVMLAAWGTMSNSSSKQRLGFAVIALSVLVAVLVPLLPGGDRIMARLDSFSDLESDRSMSARIEFTQEALLRSLTNPIGAGLGAAGANVRLNDAGESNVAFDMGVLYVIDAFGWFVGAFVLLSIVGICRWLWRSAKTSLGTEGSPYIQLAAVIFIGRAASMAAGNSFQGDAIMVLAALVGIAAHMHHGLARGVAPTEVRTGDDLSAYGAYQAPQY